VRLTQDELAGVMPAAADVPMWTAAINEAMVRFEITTSERCAAFLAHVAHESNECRSLVENLRYSAKRLRAVWPSRFPTLDAAAPYADNPEALANRVYANRLGNGDVASGDGWRFRGRGLMQITGRGNYRSTGAALGLLLEAHPDQLEQPLPAALAAAHVWASRGCNELADDRSEDNDDEDFIRITTLINGGRNGLASRRAYWARARQVLAESR
jgi:putative chitinase